MSVYAQHDIYWVYVLMWQVLLETIGKGVTCQLMCFWFHSNDEEKFTILNNLRSVINSMWEENIQNTILLNTPTL